MAETKPTFLGELEKSAMSTWTPTWTNFTVGNAVTSYRYVQVNKLIFWTLRVTLGTTSSMGSSPIFTLPVTMATPTGAGSESLQIGSAEYTNSGDNYYLGMVVYNDTTSAKLFAWGSSAAYVASQGINSTTPFSWNNPDVISAWGFYEAA